MTTPNDPQKNHTPEEFELAQDKELWELLGQSQTDKAGPLLSRNILREIRLQESDSSPLFSFWKKLFSPRVLVPGALALTAALIWNPFNEPGDTLTQSDGAEVLPIAVATSLENSLESELLLAAADTPSLFSDEEVIAMLF
ncbi:MAG: hypothetical protein ACSHYB_00785 [Roseibacillus sp.]